jgi:hypothetical protein
MLKNVVTSLFAPSDETGRWVGSRFGEMGSIFVLLGTFTEERRRGTLSPTSFISLLKDPPRDVRRAEPMLTSIGEISYWIEGRLDPPIKGSILRGSSSRKDFFLVC